MSLFSPEVRGVLQENLTGLLISEAAEQIDTLIDIYHQTHPAEPIGGIIERKNDWPKKVSEEERQAVLTREIGEAFE